MVFATVESLMRSLIFTKVYKLGTFSIAADICIFETHFFLMILEKPYQPDLKRTGMCGRELN